jgi:hypothetical protein
MQMLWPGTFELIKQYQDELYRDAERVRRGRRAIRADSTRERSLRRLVMNTLSSGGA